MKYLLLGGAGFIGTHLAKRLIKDGHTVTVIDSCITSSKPNYRVDFINADLLTCGLDSLDELISQYDIVYFLAGSVGVSNIVNNPKSTVRNNLGLTLRLIPLFEKHNKKVVFASTSEVYGEGPFSEDNNLSIGPSTNLRWSYACAKLMTEFMITTASFPYTIVRFFNVTGPGQLGDYGMVLPRFINAAKAGEDLVIHDQGQQIRSFCHVSDAVDMLLQIEKIDNEIFNVGNDDPITIKELADKVISITGTTSNIKYIPTPHSDISTRVPILTKIRSAINYKINYKLDDIIKDML
jgi:UDP-glucose 4-epimerase